MITTSQTAMAEAEQKTKSNEVKLTQTIKELVNIHLTKKMKDYEQVVTQFKKFFNSNQLQEQLDRKIDADNVKGMINLKASKKEFNQTVLILENVYDRLRNMALL